MYVLSFDSTLVVCFDVQDIFFDLLISNQSLVLREARIVNFAFSHKSFMIESG